MTNRTRVIDTLDAWVRLIVGFVAAFAVFEVTARGLESGRGEAGIPIALLVCAVLLVTERALFGERMREALCLLGFGRPQLVGMVAAAAVSVLLIATIPVFGFFRDAEIEMMPAWAWTLPGLFAQAGIAEEALFRGYLFRHLLRGRTFWPAATLAAVPFVCVHLLLLFSLPWPVALMSIVLAVVSAFPLARLFVLGGCTIWAPALLHFVIQGAIKIVAIPEDSATLLPIVWIAACAVVPYAVFLVPAVGKADECKE